MVACPCGWVAPWAEDDEPETTLALHDMIAHTLGPVAEAEQILRG